MKQGFVVSKKERRPSKERAILTNFKDGVPTVVFPDPNAKYAPGPWMVGTGRDKGHIIDADGERVCRMTNDPTMVANALLISTAPEMIRAMKWFVARVEAGEVLSKKTYAKFKEIIAKTEGRQ